MLLLDGEKNAVGGWVGDQSISFLGHFPSGPVPPSAFNFVDVLTDVYIATARLFVGL